ncbi:MAG TPA: POTRA domain-containing protein [Longimicrobium sp.]|nr:POTRA domain-containing protein [Longimicrobium sp.]
MPQTRRTPLRLALAAAALAACGPAAVAAQRPAPPPPPPAAVDTPADTARASCPRIGSIFIDNNSVFRVGDPGLDPRFTRAYRLANRLHSRTRESVIRRELLFAEGDCYRPDRLEDSERILRSTGYLADADVFSVRQPDGSYDVIVQTRDEWSTRLEATAGSGQGPGVELREDNLLGRGIRVAAYWREQQDERVYGGRVGTGQLFGTHIDAQVSLARTPVGIAAAERLVWPFRGEGAKWAGREALLRDERNFEYFVPQGDGLERRLFPVERTTFDLGVVRRLGQRGRLTLLGLAVAGERRSFPQDTLTPSDDDDPPPPGGGFVPGLEAVSNVRAVFLAGQRNVTFDRRRALDAVRGAEDVELGADVEVAVGRTLGDLSSDDDLALDLGFAAARDLPGGVLAGTRVVIEAKRDFTADSGSMKWRDVLGQVDVWSYWRPAADSRHTLVFAARAAGGWHPRVPFQVTLGSRAGLRGFPRQVYAGGRRFVASLEHRAYLAWPFSRLFDLGSAVFVDAGRTWTGGDPFGRNSPWLVSAGAGLRVAFPPGSRRTYRVDFAFPVAPDFRPRAVQISVGTGQAVGRTAVDSDPQIDRSSRRPLSSSLFDYPK